MAFPPQAFLIGAQRSATTSLSFLLNQHPMIVLAEPKEPDFLTVNWEKGLDWYRSCFSRQDAILLDASVSYTMAPITDKSAQAQAPRRAFELSPNAKFIYMVRDPAERCYSAYWHDVRAGREQRSLREAIEGRAYYSLASYYHLQMKAFLDYFPLNRFLIVTFAEFANDAQATAKKCAEFLGAVPHNFDFVLDRPRNQAFTYNRVGRILRDTIGADAMKFAARRARALLPHQLQPLVKRALQDNVPPMPARDRAWLTGLFHEDAIAFEALTGIQVLDQ